MSESRHGQTPCAGNRHLETVGPRAACRPNQTKPNQTKPPPLPMFETDSQKKNVLLRRLRCQEDLSFKIFGPAFGWNHRGTLGGGVSQPSPPPPLLIHPCPRPPPTIYKPPSRTALTLYSPHALQPQFPHSTTPQPTNQTTPAPDCSHALQPPHRTSPPALPPPCLPAPMPEQYHALLPPPRTLQPSLKPMPTTTVTCSPAFYNPLSEQHLPYNPHNRLCPCPRTRMPA